MAAFCRMMLLAALLLALCVGTSRCTEFRLVNGPSAGRLEVRHNNVWGTVCDDLFNKYAADMICKQLGYLYAVMFYTSGSGSGPIWLDNLRCTATSQDLSSCSRNGWGSHNCNHDEDVGLLCGPEFRLVNGKDSLSGRVEVRYNGEWGTVCDDRFNQGAADAICKHLGFWRGERVDPYPGYGEGSGTIWLDDVRCWPSRQGLFNCTHNVWGIEDCGHYEDVSLDCVPEFRLVNGTNPSSGRIEVRYDGEWGTVCDDFFNQHSGNTICKLLGFSGAERVVHYADYGAGSGTIWLDELQCPSSSQGLFECSHLPWGSHNCYHYEDAGVDCTPEFRLVNGSNLSSGRLEVRFNNMWGTVCGGQFNQGAGDLICKKLGFLYAVRIHSSVQYGRGSGPIWIDRLSCSPSSQYWSNCTHSAWGSHNCDHDQDVGLDCMPEFRLVNGPSLSAGRIEVQYNNTWGTVCDDRFNQAAGDMICKQFGFMDAAHIYSSSQYGRGYGQIWLDNLICSPSSQDLSTCTYDFWGSHDCNHDEDVGLDCMPKFRLVNGPNYSSGRVEMLYNDTWGTVCNESFNQHEGDMICRRLGFRRASHIWSSARYGPGSDEIWLSNLTCSPSSHDLSSCTHNNWGIHACDHSQDVGLDCVPEFRLVDGPNLGILEVRYNGTWGTVCADSFNQHAANVICKELGFRGPSRLHPSDRFKSVSSQIWLDNLKCSASNESFAACTYNKWGAHDCDHEDDVALGCLPEIRLVNGTTSASGRIELFYQDEWGTVCDDSFDQNAGDMICKALGFDFSSKLAPNGHYGHGSGRIWLDDLKCDNGDNGLLDCTHNKWGEHNCDHEEDMGIACDKIMFKLVDGPTPSFGRLEVFFRGEWGTVCDEDFSNNEADVICKAMGFDHALHVALRSQFGMGVGPIWLGDLSCPEVEQGLSGCTYTARGRPDCTHDDDVGLECERVDNMYRGIQRTAFDGMAQEFRLTDGLNDTCGRIEVRHGGRWGTVCDDSFNQEAGDMICRRMGFDRASRLAAGSQFGRGSGPIWLDELTCMVDPSGHLECVHNGWGQNDCNHGEDMGLVCAPVNPTAADGQD